MSYLIHVECTVCSRIFDSSRIQTYCLECKAPLLARYDITAVRTQTDRDEISGRQRGMWRWRELLPLENPNNQVSLGEGDTPLLQLPRLGECLGLRHLYVKDERLNPTGSFKARGLSTAVSKAKELGVKRIVIPSAGNAGGALAAYAARAGMEACILMPKDTPLANIEESRITGSLVILVDGLISEAARMAELKASEEGWFNVSTFKEPYRVEGKKVMGFELAEGFDWKLPEVIIYPTGGGTGLVGIWKAFEEMEALGWLENAMRPRMVSVQSEGCAPIVAAYDQGAQSCDYWDGAQTIASGLRVPKSFADFLILREIRESGGIAVAVSDATILQAQKQLASTEGIFAAPEGAASLAALIKLVERGWVKPDERIVIFNTGTGLKYLR